MQARAYQEHLQPSQLHLPQWGGLFYLQLGFFYLRLVFVTYGGLLCLRLKFGLVFFTYG